MSEDAGRTRRFFLARLPAAGETASLPPAEAHHALHVLRLKSGAPVELFDGQGGSAEAAIASVSHGAVTVTVLRALPPRRRQGPLIHLGFAQPKGKRLDWLLEKATELGAASLTPVRFERSVAGAEGLAAAARERWLGHCIAAAKQCGLDYLPRLEPPAGLEEFLEASRATLPLLGDLGADAILLKDAASRRAADQDVRILVGPEGGLTPEERSLSLSAGFLPVRLGTTTLRIETAAVALLAAARAVCSEG